MDKKYAIGLDLGTSSVKGVLSDGENVLATAGAEFDIAECSLADGSVYLGFDAEEYFKIVAGVIKTLAEKSPCPVSGIAMAGASGNTLLIKDGKPSVKAYSWINGAFDDEVERVFGTLDGDDVARVSGWQFFNTFPLSHLAHIKIHAGELLESADKVAMTTEYILYRLTGRWGMDRSSATPFYLADQVAGKWHKPYLNKLGIGEEKLPPLMQTGDYLANVFPEMKELTGLDENVKVYLGGFDHPSAARANGIDAEGKMLLSCGTSWVCFFPLRDRDKILKNKLLCDPFLWKKGLWGGIFSFAQVSEKIDRVLAKYVGKEGMPARFDALAEKAESGCGGLKINPVTDWEKDFSGYSEENVCRALMEGMARAVQEKLREFAKKGIVFKEIAMAGGPSKSAIWVKIIKEITGLDVTVKYGACSGAVGAAKLALGENG